MSLRKFSNGRIGFKMLILTDRKETTKSKSYPSPSRHPLPPNKNKNNNIRIPNSTLILEANV